MDTSRTVQCCCGRFSPQSHLVSTLITFCVDNDCKRQGTPQKCKQCRFRIIVYAYSAKYTDNFCAPNPHTETHYAIILTETTVKKTFIRYCAARVKFHGYCEDLWLLSYADQVLQFLKSIVPNHYNCNWSRRDCSQGAVARRTIESWKCLTRRM